MYEELIKMAKDKLVDGGDNIESQITILLSANNVFYVAVDDLDGSICESLKSNNDTKITRMLTMWKDGAIDLSSFAFRRALIQTNKENYDTEIILQGWDCYNIKKLSVTI